MRSHSEAAFVSWVEGQGIKLAPGYPKTATLLFSQSIDETRFWSIPAEPERRPFFIRSLLELTGAWNACYVWRHSGSWNAAKDIHPNRINDWVEYQILKGINVPTGTADVLEFARDELHELITLIFTISIFGWSVGSDLYLVLDNARFILHVSHHAVIHVNFAYAPDMPAWVAKMEELGFPLPEEPPDDTFKRPKWM